MEQLLEQARSGNAEAFIRIIELNRQSLYKVARSYFTEAMDVEDAISDTVLACWEHLNQIKRPEYLKTWLIRVLINKCKDIKRRQARILPTDVLPETPIPDPDPGDLGFESLVNCLPEVYRPVVVLFYGEGFSVRETAALLKLPTGTVTSRLKRARQYLANILKGED